MTATLDWRARRDRLRIMARVNMHEEPIVCTPDDAIRAFLQGNLDYLAMGDFLIEHPARSARDASA